jgi:zinc transporter 5/7
MASTYALPMVPANHTHSHERSDSQYSAYSNGSAANSSPMRGQGRGHRHQPSDMSANGQMHGAVRSPYAEYNNQAHEHNHGHNRTSSTDSAWTIQPFANGRTKGRSRGDSDLGRSPPRKHLAANKFGFSAVSPIQETEPILPNLPSS